MQSVKRRIVKLVAKVLAPFFASKLNLTNIQTTELIENLIVALRACNFSLLSPTIRFLHLVFADMDWKHFRLTENLFYNRIPSPTYISTYQEPIGMWFTIDSEERHENTPQIQNTEHVTYYASGREPFLAVANQATSTSKTVLMPNFVCGTVYQPFLENGWNVVYYRVTRDLKIDSNTVERAYEKYKPSIAVFMEYSGMDLADDELYTIGKLKRDGCVIVVDRTQNIYSDKKAREVDYYCGSLRKWFCCPDGAYLESNGENPLPPPPPADEYNDVYATTCAAMMFANGLARKRKIKEYFEIGRFFRRLSGSYICDQPVRTRNMSEYSKSVYLQERNKDTVYMDVRKRNYEYIFSRVASFSTIQPVVCDPSRITSVPFCFHVYVDNRKKLTAFCHKRGVMLWNHVPRPFCFGESYEEIEYMYQHILSLPCDQRYSESDMKALCDVLEEYEIANRKTAI